MQNDKNMQDNIPETNNLPETGEGQVIESVESVESVQEAADVGETTAAEMASGTEGMTVAEETVETEESAAVEETVVAEEVAAVEELPVDEGAVAAEEVAEAEESVAAEEVVETDGSSEVENTPVVQNADAAHNRRVIKKRPASSRVYAGFFVRLTAYLLDKIIIGVPLVIVRLILWSLQDMDSANILVRKIFFSFTLTDIILYIISIAYFVFMTYLMGRTFGKRIMKLKVVSAEDRKPTLFEIAFREIIGRYLSTVILWIGYLMIGAGDQKEALHDYLADTRVIYALD